MSGRGAPSRTVFPPANIGGSPAGPGVPLARHSPPVRRRRSILSTAIGDGVRGQRKAVSEPQETSNALETESGKRETVAMSLSVDVAGKTDIGCVRTNNEDNFGFDARYGIFVVCDGMGGQAAGELASKIGVDTMLNYFRQAHETGVQPQIGAPVEGVSLRANALGSAIRLSNEAVYQAAQKHADHAGMGSTLVAVLVDGDFYSLGHVGDSRVYLLRAGKLQQMTQDHSLVMEQVRRGLISLEEAQSSEMQNIIIKALGPEPHVEPDLDDQAALSGDLLLLCSDGLTRHVSDDNIEEILNHTLSLQLACERLIDAAREGGGLDNITCVLLRFVQRPWHRRLSRSFGRLFGGGSPQWQNSI